jgi:hypothetical protein
MILGARSVDHSGDRKTSVTSVARMCRKHGEGNVVVGWYIKTCPGNYVACPSGYQRWSSLLYKVFRPRVEDRQDRETEREGIYLPCFDTSKMTTTKRKYLGGSGNALTVWISLAASTVLVFYGYDQVCFCLLSLFS